MKVALVTMQLGPDYPHGTERYIESLGLGLSLISFFLMGAVANGAYLEAGLVALGLCLAIERLTPVPSPAN